MREDEIDENVGVDCDVTVMKNVIDESLGVRARGVDDDNDDDGVVVAAAVVSSGDDDENGQMRSCGRIFGYRLNRAVGVLAFYPSMDVNYVTGDGFDVNGGVDCEFVADAVDTASFPF